MMDEFDASLEKISANAYVHFGSSDDANMRYLTRFTVHDPILYIRCRGEQGRIVVPQMEYERACAEKNESQIISRKETNFFTYLKEGQEPASAYAGIIEDMTAGSVAVPSTFPFGLAHELMKRMTVVPDGGIVESRRMVKSDIEAGEIRKAQEAAENAIRIASGIIAGADARNGILFREGEELTSERLRATMHRMLIESGYSARDTIVSCGSETSLPHMVGSGPIFENEPIVIDCFPRSESSGYYGDMTRSFVKGEPSEMIAEMHEAVLEAQKIAISMIKPDVPGSNVHTAVTDYFNDMGFPTGSEGFVHNLGHGVGLEVHEGPSLGPNGKELKKGNIITIEPGLYYGSAGGIRIEDTGIVTRKGFESFSILTRELVL